jgi:hypothetical protein
MARSIHRQAACPVRRLTERCAPAALALHASALHLPSVSTRYKVFLDDVLIGTVYLVGPALRVERARLGAKPAYKRLARLRQRVEEARSVYDEQTLAAPEGVLADEESAFEELSSLSLTLVEEGGATASAAAVRLVGMSPPTLRVEW